MSDPPPVTISRIAEQAQVSKATVSRVLNNKPDVDPETAARVREAIRRLGYVPNAGAIALARGRAFCIGLLIPSLTWPLMLDLLRGVTEGVEASGYALMLYSMTRGEASLRDFTAQVVRARQIDGLVVVIPDGMLDALVNLQLRLPMILVDDRGLKPSFASVSATNFEGGFAAARHLLGAGRHRLALINGPPDFGCNRDRVAGFHAALAQAGLTPDPRLARAGDFTVEGGAAMAQLLIDGGLEFDGLFACNDQMALGAMQALQRAGRCIPDEIAIVGFDDIPAAAFTTPSLTTIRQPFYEMGLTASRLLLESLKGGPLPTAPVQLPTALVVRCSSASNHTSPAPPPALSPAPSPSEAPRMSETHVVTIPATGPRSNRRARGRRHTPPRADDPG